MVFPHFFTVWFFSFNVQSWTLVKTTIEKEQCKNLIQKYYLYMFVIFVHIIKKILKDYVYVELYFYDLQLVSKKIIIVHNVAIIKL